jgi:hypothetical protein
MLSTTLLFVQLFSVKQEDLPVGSFAVFPSIVTGSRFGRDEKNETMMKLLVMFKGGGARTL